MCTDNTLDRMLQKVVQPDGYYLECTLVVCTLTEVIFVSLYSLTLDI